MAFPQNIDPTSPVGTDSPRLGDDQLRALKQFLADVFGIVVSPTTIAAACGSISTAGKFTVTSGLWNGDAIGVAYGGTNLTSYAVGDLVYASGATTLSRLADVAVGSYLRSGGVATAPLWSSYTLPATAGAVGKLLRSDGTNVVTSTATYPDTAGGVNNVLTSDGTNWTSAVPAAAAIGNPVTGGTAGSVLFVGAGSVLAQNNANLFWDTTNTRLSVGTTSPNSAVSVSAPPGTGTNLSAGQVSVQNNTVGSLLCGIVFRKNDTTPLWEIGNLSSTVQSFFLVDTVANVTRLYVNASGNFGVGTTNPSTFLLQVAGSIGPNVTGVSDLGSAALAFKRLYVDYTNTATVGAVTINKAAGRVNFSGTATSLVVTNSLVTAASHVFAIVSSVPASNAVIVSVVPAAGSFTINLNGQFASQTSVDFFVVNAD